jgi:hypothetical protein
MRAYLIDNKKSGNENRFSDKTIKPPHEAYSIKNGPQTRLTKYDLKATLN